MTSFLLLCTMIGSFGQVQTIGNIEYITIVQGVAYVKVVGPTSYTTADGIKTKYKGNMYTTLEDCKLIRK